MVRLHLLTLGNRGWPSWKTERALLSFEITSTDLASFPILPFGGYDEGQLSNGRHGRKSKIHEGESEGRGTAQRPHLLVINAKGSGATMAALYLEPPCRPTRGGIGLAAPMTE